MITNVKKLAPEQQLLILLMLEDNADWVLLTLSTTFSLQNVFDTWVSCSAPKHAYRSPHFFLGCDASGNAQCPTVTWTRASWMVSRRNICSLGSYVGWLVTIKRQHYFFKLTLDPLLQKIVARTSWTFKIFWQWAQRICLFFKCFNHFPTNAEVFSFNFAQKCLPGFSANL